MPTSREALIEERRTPDGVALLALRNGRLNTLTRPLRTDLIEALDRAEADDRIHAVVLYGASGTFSAGADLAEFDSGEGLAEPSLHATILSFIDEMTKPVIALIEGLALGGGLELALGCHYRLATPDARIGLPEVTFGFLPGAGGTQRLPRAVGLERSLSMMLTGETADAASIGEGALIARVLGADPLAEAIAFAIDVVAQPLPRLRDVAIDGSARDALLAFAARAVRESGPHTAVVAAVTAGADDIDRGFEEEQRLFSELAEAESASARRHLFLAQRAARRRPSDSTPRPPIGRVGVVGGGTMGRGIALAHAIAGLQVHLVEAGPEQVAAASAALATEAARAARSRANSVADPTEILTRISCSAQLTDIAEVDLVIEAVPEDLALKLDIFARLDRVVRSGALLATNTSSLDVDAIARSTSRPADVLGLHFFSPAHVMKLLEVIRGEGTSDATLAAALTHAQNIGKVPVVSGVGPGFIGNRVLESSSREIAFMLLEGATPIQIDTALQRWGMRMGPFRVLDLVGNDVPMLTRVAAGTADNVEWRVARELVARGWLGDKTGRGWFRHESGSPVPDHEVEELIREVAREASIAPRSHTDREIVERAVLAMVNEGAAVLEEGVASRAGDIDVVFTLGYGFPVDRGGPMHLADTMGLPNVLRIMNRYAARPGGDRWHPRRILVESARAGRSVAEWVSA